MLVLMLQHISPRLAGFFGAVALSMGEAAKPFLVAGFKTGCNVVLRGRRGASCQPNMFHDVSSVVLCGRCSTLAMFAKAALQFSWQAQHFGDLKCHFAWQAHRFRHVLLHMFLPIAMSGLRNVVTLTTPHSTLYTPHFYTLHSTISIPHVALYTPHFQLYTQHSKLYTLHFTPYT